MLSISDYFLPCTLTMSSPSSCLPSLSTITRPSYSRTSSYSSNSSNKGKCCNYQHQEHSDQYLQYWCGRILNKLNKFNTFIFFPKQNSQFPVFEFVIPTRQIKSEGKCQYMEYLRVHRNVRQYHCLSNNSREYDPEQAKRDEYTFDTKIPVVLFLGRQRLLMDKKRTKFQKYPI